MRYPDYYRFVAVFAFYEGGISITFPDLPGCVSNGSSEEEAITCAKEALQLHLYGMETDGEEIPAASPINSISKIYKLKDGEVFTLIEVFMPPFREKQSTRFVKKTLSIPYWLNVEAENKGVNFSKTLQDALKSQLHVQ